MRQRGRCRRRRFAPRNCYVLFAGYETCQTIDVLRLNSDDYMVQVRCDIMLDFVDGNISFSFLKRKYPFLASEIVRQDIETTCIRYLSGANPARFERSS